MHHLRRFSSSDAAASTQCDFHASWICIALALLKQCLICIQFFGSLFSNVNMKTAIVEQEAASAVISVYTLTKKKYTEHSIRASYWCSHSVVFKLCLINQNQSIWKISSFYCLIRLGFPFRAPYRLYHQHAPYTWSLCKEMCHNVCRYEYLTFQTEVHFYN